MRQNGSWVVLAIVALFAVEAVAVETDAELRRFQRRIWTVEQGLPHDGVLAVAQTTDGYLWFATLRGLARFDGVNFTNFTDKSSTLTPDTIADVTAGPLDDLWIAHTSLSHYQNGTFTSWDASKGLPEKVKRA